jgi:thiamine-phosphate pyrophosphorylase
MTGAASIDVRRLPRVLVLTDRHQATAPLRDVVAAAIDAGARVVVLREQDLPEDERRSLVAQLAPVVHEAGGVLLTAGTHLRDADGVHQPPGGGSPAPASTSGLITGRSCHDSDELRAAELDGVDYVTVSPVYASASKPGYGPALGVGGLASLLAATKVPVYALGGIDTPEAVVACRSAGAHGVAVMGAIMRARRPGPLVAELLAAADAGPA